MEIEVVILKTDLITQIPDSVEGAKGVQVAAQAFKKSASHYSSSFTLGDNFTNVGYREQRYSNFVEEYESRKTGRR